MKKTKRTLNYSISHKRYLRSLKLNRLYISIGRWSLLIILLILWEFIANAGIVDPFITSSPSRIFFKLKDLFVSNEIYLHVRVTLTECILSFTLSTIIGVAVALLLYLLPFVRKILDPYLVILNSLPKVALGPLILVWVGTGTKAVVTMGILICIIITILSMLGGYLKVDQDKIKLMQTMGANRFQIMHMLVIPSTLPEFISVLKINVGMAWVGVIMGEYLSSKAGLGYLIVYGGQFFDLDQVMASIFVICVLASLMYFLVSSLEYLLNKKR
ncbi:MAG: ABC transporter permease [Clostridia bacterium]